MHRCLFFFFFLLYFPININNEIEKASELSGHEEIIAFRKILSEISYNKDTSAFLQLKLGDRYERIKNEDPLFIDSAKYYYIKAFNYFCNNNRINKASRATIKLAAFYRKTGFPSKAFITLNKGFEYIDFENIDDYLSEFTQLLIGNHNYKLNISALKFQMSIQPSYGKDNLTKYENLFKLSQQDTIDQNPASIKYLKDALLLIKTDTSLYDKRMGILNELGIRYKEYGDYKNSELYYKMMNDGSPEFKANLSLYHNNLGELYTKMKKFKLAEFHVNKAFRILSDNKETPLNYFALNVAGKAVLKENMGDYHSAFSFTNDALKTYSFDKNNLDEIDFLDHILELKYYRYYIQKKISKDYFNVDELKEIDLITDALRKRQTDEASKIDTRKSAIAFYKEAAGDCIAHDSIKLALYFKEKAKSILLIENYLQLTNEKEILDFQYAVDDLLKQKDADSIAITKVFAKLKPILQLIVKKYETNSGIDNVVFSDAIEKSLANHKPDHAYLDFFETEKEMLVFVITNKIIVHRLKLNPHLADTIRQYNEAVLSEDGDLCLAPIIYDAIIKPLGHLPKNLTIIPDSYLSYLPFEALHTGSHLDAKDYSTYDFMVKKHNIDYNYSLGMISLMKEKKCTSRGKHVYLPTFTLPPLSKEKSFATDRQTLIPLRYAKEEASNINQLFWTTFYKKKSASKNNFIKSLQSANLIHFAGHAIINHEDHHLSYLAFNSQEKDESRLYLKDIAGVASNADLIVLSACQTAAGKYSAGEGLLSLGRAMVSCGSKSVVTSLWNVNDSSGKDIISTFYKNMKEGKDKSNALHDAKLDFLNSIKSNKLGHPRFWSAFIFMGDDSPLNVENNYTKYLFFIALLIAGFALIGFLNKKYSFTSKVKM